MCPSCGYTGPDLLQHVAAAIAFGACPVWRSEAKAQREFEAALELVRTREVRVVLRAPKNGKAAPAYVDWHRGECRL